MWTRQSTSGKGSATLSRNFQTFAGAKHSSPYQTLGPKAYSEAPKPSVREALLEVFQETARIYKLNRNMVEKQVIVSGPVGLSFQAKSQRWLKSWKKVRNALRFIAQIKSNLYEKAFFGVDANPRDFVAGRTETNECRKFLQFITATEPLDSHPDEARRPYLIYEDSWFARVWYALTIITYLYVSFFVPFQVALLADVNLQWLDILFDVRFYLDILLNFFCVHSVEGRPVHALQDTALNYLRSWFLFDFACAFPLASFVTPSDASSTLLHAALQEFQMLRFIGLTSTLYRKRFFRLLKSLYDFSKKLTEFITFFIILTFCTHIVACFWIFLNNLEDTEACAFAETSNPFPQNSIIEIYVLALVWAYNTFCGIGLGLLTAVNSLERGFMVGMIMLCTAYYTFHLGALSNLLSESRKVSTVISNRFAFLNDVASKRAIDDRLLHSITSTLEYQEASRSVFNNDLAEGFLQDVSLELTYELTRHLYSSLINRVMLFQNRNIYFVSQIVQYIQPRKVGAGEVIYLNNSHANFMYFITAGKVGLFKNHNNPFRVYLEGAYFGEIEILKSSLREYTSRALTDTHLLMLPKDVFLAKMDAFTDIHEEILLTALKRDILNKHSEMVFDKLNFMMINRKLDSEAASCFAREQQSAFDTVQVMKQEIKAWAKKVPPPKAPEEGGATALEKEREGRGIHKLPSRASSSRTLHSARRSEPNDKMNNVNLNLIKLRVEQVRTELRLVNQMIMDLLSHFMNKELLIFPWTRFKNFGVQKNLAQHNQLLADELEEWAKKDSPSIEELDHKAAAKLGEQGGQRVGWAEESKGKQWKQGVRAPKKSQVVRLGKMLTDDVQGSANNVATTAKSLSLGSGNWVGKARRNDQVSMQTVERVPVQEIKRDPGSLLSYFKRIILRRHDVVSDKRKDDENRPLSFRDSGEPSHSGTGGESDGQEDPKSKGGSGQSYWGLM